MPLSEYCHRVREKELKHYAYPSASALPRSQRETFSGLTSTRELLWAQRLKPTWTQATFVPDSLTNKMVHDRLFQDDVSEGFLLDGYPRTTAQVDYLDEILLNSGLKLDIVLQLSADDDELVTRMLGRAKETGRSDDTAAVIRHRLDLCHRETEAVVAQYAARGILAEVDGSGDIEGVALRVFEAVSQRSSSACPRH